MSNASTAATWVHIDKLQPWDRNPRNNDEAAKQLAKNIKEFGFTVPLVVQAGTDRIIAGHTRQKAVRMLLRDNAGWQAEGAPAPGMLPVRYIAVDDRTAAKLTISDNRLATIADWDEQQLVDLLGEFDMGDLGNLGFDQQELTALLGQWEDPFPENADEEAVDNQVSDNGVAMIMVTVSIPVAQDAAMRFRTALQDMLIAASAYKLSIK